MDRRVRSAHAAVSRHHRRETSFSIDANNDNFPPRISGSQNALVAYAMNQEG